MPLTSCPPFLLDPEQLLRHVLESTDDAIVTKARDGTITSWNSGAERLYGYSAEEAIGRPNGMLVPPERAGEERQLLHSVFRGTSIDRLETERLRKDGESVAVSLAIFPIRDRTGRVVGAATIGRDITAQRRYEERLMYLSDYDQLTGLYNRRRFEEELKHELARSGRYHSVGALLAIDLDNFKSTNDSVGHAAGDTVLSAVARVLERHARSSDVVARLGADEFAMLLPAIEAADAHLSANELLDAIHGCRPIFGG
jgi:PAS domain S-box-containing protein